jgi:prophage antirepressor-like protein
VVERLGDNEKDAVTVSDAIGRLQAITIVNQSGLYETLLG